MSNPASTRTVAAVLALNDAAGIAAVADLDLRELLAARAAHVLENAGDDYALDELVTFIVVEPGDAPDAIGRVLGFSPLGEPWGGPRYGDPAFRPSWELLEDLGAWYELVFVMSDDGFGYEVFGPRPRASTRSCSPCARSTPFPPRTLTPAPSCMTRCGSGGRSRLPRSGTRRRRALCREGTRLATGDAVVGVPWQPPSPVAVVAPGARFRGAGVAAAARSGEWTSSKGVPPSGRLKAAGF